MTKQGKSIPLAQGWLLAHNLKFKRNPLGFMQTLHRNYGDIVAVSKKHTFVFSLTYIKQVLGNAHTFHTVTVPFPTPPNSALARLFTIPGQMNGSENTHQRQIMLATLHQKYYKRYYKGIVNVTQRQLAQWKIGQQRDILPEMNQITLKTPCQAIFGLNPEKEGKRIVKLVEAWGDKLIDPNTSLFPFNIKGLAYNKILGLSEQLEAEYWQLIKQHQALGLPPKLPLSFLIEQYNNNNLSDAALIGQVNNLFNAGNTSRASVLAWTFFLLSQHPELLIMIQAELARNLKGNIPTPTELANLVLLEAAIKETMRLLPPVSWLSRLVKHNTHLDGYPIAKDSLIICSPFVIQRNPDIYPDPHRFWAERWLTSTPDIYAYLPFGAGPRACIGSNLALFEIKLVLAIILQRYQLRPPAQSNINSTGHMVSVPESIPMEILAHDSPISKQPVLGNIHQLIKLTN